MYQQGLSPCPTAKPRNLCHPALSLPMSSTVGTSKPSYNLWERRCIVPSHNHGERRGVNRKKRSQPGPVAGDALEVLESLTRSRVEGPWVESPELQVGTNLPSFLWQELPSSPANSACRQDNVAGAERWAPAPTGRERRGRGRARRSRLPWPRAHTRPPRRGWRSAGECERGRV